ncbi:hypothetical protein NST62_06965 [Ureibacillus sp. FSL K6-8385]|uniref:Uncharacterized protein n=1 Tax=Ureibacillus terrenus TaxID=118246 RepID=A0A540V1D4_9BACL|nr:hypothetical protein [Ureibacillus terrenus]MED3662668.1 hypothetical protein [Ureibacillus terrenus]MED3764492.1 hypothetical protein [Ureibacillus terrenus]TQE90548.1 hypothetical protein FKZ59_09765 [Ureibacillus terrenus]
MNQYKDILDAWITIERLSEAQSIRRTGLFSCYSNNAAVQNIVNEIPKTEEISNEFLEELIKADYFTDIANSQLEKNFLKGTGLKSNKRKLMMTIVARV